MDKTRHIGDLELAEDLEFQRHEWIAERIGWAILLLLLASALLGFLGPGHFSNVSASSADGKLRAKYQRFARYQAPAELRLSLTPEAGTRTVRVSFRNDYLDKTKVEDIQPQPLQVSSERGWTTYIFQADEEDVPIVIRFSLQMESFGSVTLGLRRENSELLLLNQFVFP